MKQPNSLTFGALIRELADSVPENLAVADLHDAVSFRVLHEKSAGVAKGLLNVDVKKGDAVAILAANSVQWLVVALGILRIGAVFAPLNTWYKAPEIKRSLAHSETKCVFAARRLLNQDFDQLLCEAVPELTRERFGRGEGSTTLEHFVQFDKTLASAVAIDEFIAEGEAAISDTRLRDAESAVCPDDVAFLLYTSGSTSDPKGVQLSHGAAISNDFQIGERLGLVAEDRIWVGSPLFYSFALVNAIPAAWTHGAAILVQEYFEPGLAIELMERYGATGYYGFGNMTRAIISHPTFKPAKLRLSKGQTGFTAADKRVAIEQLGVKGCCSMYGLTESYANCAVTDADDPIDVKLQTQGRPLPGWDLKVVDPESETPLPAGEVGHLLIKGFVTAGYYRNPEATAAAFDAQGYFRTGDLASIGTDGRLRFHSRLKEVLKVGGINVSPHEVEEILLSHESVLQAYVVGVPDEIKGDIMVAFVDAANAKLDATVLQQYVRERAASFKVPAFVIFCNDATLPRLATGKIPRYKLREMALGLVKHGRA
jgi:fatty-acyl-CoA synthase